MDCIHIFINELLLHGEQKMHFNIQQVKLGYNQHIASTASASMMQSCVIHFVT